MERKGIDISTWQGASVDFEALKSSGVEFVIIRAGYGQYTSQKDKQFENNYAKAKAAGMPVGAYWYSYATSTAGARREAQACLEVIKDKQFEYPIYFDLEDPSQSGLSKTVKSNMVVAFCEVLEEAGYFAGLYANLNWLNNYLDYDKISHYTIWLAQWSSNPTYKNPFDMWQYTSDGSVSGVSGRVDMNICYKDFPSIIKAEKLNGFSDSSVSEGLDPSEPETSPGTSSGFKVGDKVKVKSGSKSYSGQSIASFVYDNTYTIDEISGNRAVLDKDGICTAFNTDDLVLASSSTGGSTTSSSIKEGDTVRVNSGAKTYEGKGLADFVYSRNHTVSQVSGDRAVITYDGVVVAAVNVKDLTKVGSSTSTSTSISKGDKVKLKSGAVWATGQSIPNWVFQKTLYVRSTPSNGKCNVSTLQSGDITGVAYVKDLSKV